MSEAPPLAGVIGWPIGHSRSPRLHGHWLRRYGIAGHYIPIALCPEEFADGVRSLPRLGFRGVNVTIPHKEAALALADTASDLAVRVGAANTLTFGVDGRIAADNTDGYGFLASLRQEAPGWVPASGPAVVLGAGGASRAVIAALLEAGVPEVRLANRTRARADALVAHLGGALVAIDWDEAEAAAQEAALLVNTTAVGMGDDDALPISLAAMPHALLVMDIVYGGVPTPLVAEARRLGMTAIDGLGMLLHQGVPGFERWFGRRPEVDADLRAAVLAP